MNDTLLIFLGATKKQATFWEHYHERKAGRNHDIMIAYIDRSIVPNVKNDTGEVFYENKVVDGKDIPHRAFGAYRYFFNKYKDKYDYFAFISDDVILRCDNWLKKSIDPLTHHKKLGWTATQLLTKKASGCFPDHLRAPIWFAKKEALAKISWKLKDDHNGEERIANQFLRAGYYGIQVGNKIDVAYDSLENGGLGVGDGIISSFEKKFFKEKNLVLPFTEEESRAFNRDLWQSIKDRNVGMWDATSPYRHIQTRNFITELQGLDGQVYTPALVIAREDTEVFENDTYNIQVLKEFVPDIPGLPLVKKTTSQKEKIKTLWYKVKNS